MTEPIRDVYAGRLNGNGTNRVTFVMEWVWRIITVIILPVVVYMLVQISAIHASVASIQARVLVIEQRTQMLPPLDYRAYIDAKFQVVTDQLNELTTDLKLHMREP